MSTSAPSSHHDAATSTSAFATWRLLRASSDVFADHTAATFDLLLLEWQAERARVLQLLFLTLIAGACIFLLIGFAGLLLLAAVWETPLRIPAAAALMVLFAVVGWLSWRKSRSLDISGVQPFATLREELKKDRELFQAQTREVRE